MKGKKFNNFMKECLSDVVEHIVVFTFLILVFLFFLWVSSFWEKLSIPMVILVTFIIFMFGAKPLKVHLAAKRLKLLTRHYLDILFP
ncbi:hypothetical protein KKJ25_19870 [Xenorhabdus bovienii]|uniref:hypothetical protein n=1 Tax=Xenorhabdus bovienii TaxID=40576 RepID=UPI00237CF061|nr:hypothetical protein [Xenorhabdus bovienii]MDE1497124.1 hypothetical protein [Xenorhabdus bovienii]